MDDPAKVIVAVVFFVSVAYSIKAIAQAAVAHRREEAKDERGSTPPLSEARLARIEQAVEAIALEVERISEGQRFTTRLLSEQSRPTPKPVQRQLSTNTPT
ncbi:MAG TPA: hypothetical protein VF387_07085 [Gemmatimonadaceae bacterium]